MLQLLLVLNMIVSSQEIAFTLNADIGEAFIRGLYVWYPVAGVCACAYYNFCLVYM